VHSPPPCGSQHVDMAVCSVLRSWAEPAPGMRGATRGSERGNMGWCLQTLHAARLLCHGSILVHAVRAVRCNSVRAHPVFYAV
jgi:hypothetical protein